MVSPARAHKQAVLAAKSADVDLTAAEPYRRLQFLLAQDKRALKAIKGVDKIAAKKQMIEKYRDWLTEVYASGKAQSTDNVFSTALLWLVDIGELEEAAPLAEFAISQGLQAADEFQRDMADLMFEEFAESMSRGAELSEEAQERLIGILTALDETSGLHRLNIMDQVRAKFLKACGEQSESDERTLKLFEKAVAYNPKIGVKKQIEALKKKLGV